MKEVRNLRVEIIGEVKPFIPKDQIQPSDTKFFSVQVSFPQYEKNGDLYRRIPSVNCELIVTNAAFGHSIGYFKKGLWLDVSGDLNKCSEGCCELLADKISLPLDLNHLEKFFYIKP